MPQLAAPVPTRNAAVTARGTSAVKYVSTCGPPGTSMHSVSRGGAIVGRMSTRTVGPISWVRIEVAARVGRSSRLTRFSSSPG
nr:hypothetical protein [Microbispora camponoti]